MRRCHELRLFFLSVMSYRWIPYRKILISLSQNEIMTQISNYHSNPKPSNSLLCIYCKSSSCRVQISLPTVSSNHHPLLLIKTNRWWCRIYQIQLPVSSFEPQPLISKIISAHSNEISTIITHSNVFDF